MPISMDPEDEHRHAAVLAALAEQMASAETPEVKATYDRLRDLGLEDEEARDLMAVVLEGYIVHIALRDSYTYADYVRDLAKLPELEDAE